MATFWAILGQQLATFYANIWSHWMQHKFEHDHGQITDKHSINKQKRALVGLLPCPSCFADLMHHFAN